MPRLIALCLFLLSAPPALACRLALAMGFDVSRSVDARDYAIQIDGIRAAFADPDVQAALFEPDQPVALALYEWSGEHQQVLIADWALIRTPADLAALDARIAAHVRRHEGLTAVGTALIWGHRLLQRAPRCAQQVLDISGDGYVNVGPPPARVYARTDFSGITVNGLAIGGHESGILRWYAAEVMRGPGAFVEYAPTHRDFAAAFRRKLLHELSAPPLARAPDQPPAWPASARSISATVSSTP
jgi:hypothetical protein